MYRNEESNQDCQMPPGFHRQVRIESDREFIINCDWELEDIRTYKKMDRNEPEFLRIQKSILTHWSQRDEHQEGAMMNKVETEDNLDPITGQYQGITPIYTARKKKKSAMKKAMKRK